MIDLEDMKKLFADNAFYLLAHHRRILADGRMAQCSLPGFLAMPFINTTGKKNQVNNRRAARYSPSQAPRGNEKTEQNTAGGQGSP